METWAEMEARHERERRSLLEKIKNNAFLAGVSDRVNPRVPDPMKQKMNRILSGLCTDHNVMISKVLSHSRKKELVQVRHKCWHIMRSQPKDKRPTLEQIGEYFNRDHGTVLSGIKSYQRKIEGEACNN